jgi:hypothetical protein
MSSDFIDGLVDFLDYSKTDTTQPSSNYTQHLSSLPTDRLSHDFIHNEFNMSDSTGLFGNASFSGSLHSTPVDVPGSIGGIGGIGGIGSMSRSKSRLLSQRRLVYHFCYYSIILTIPMFCPVLIP